MKTIVGVIISGILWFGNANAQDITVRIDQSNLQSLFNQTWLKVRGDLLNQVSAQADANTTVYLRDNPSLWISGAANNRLTITVPEFKAFFARRYVDLFQPLSAMGRLQVFERADALPRRLNLDR